MHRRESNARHRWNSGKLQVGLCTAGLIAVLLLPMREGASLGALLGLISCLLLGIARARAA